MQATAPKPESQAPAILPATTRLLLVFARRRRLLRLARSFLLAAALSALWVTLWCALDRLFHLGVFWRTAAFLVNVGFVAALILRSLLRRSSPLQTAADIERLDGRFGQRLLTVVSGFPCDGRVAPSPEFLATLADEVERLASQRIISPPWRRLWPAAVFTLIALAIAGLPLMSSVLGWEQLIRRYAVPWSALPPVTTTRIVVQPGDIEVSAGDSARIVAEIRNRREPDPYAALSADGRNFTRVPMSDAGGGRFVLVVPAVWRELRYRIHAGDAVSPLYVLRPVRPTPATRP